MPVRSGFDGGTKVHVPSESSHHEAPRTAAPSVDVNHMAMNHQRAMSESHAGDHPTGAARSGTGIAAGENSGAPRHLPGGDVHMLEGEGVQLPFDGHDVIEVFPDKGSIDSLTSFPATLGEQEITLGAFGINGLEKMGPASEALQNSTFAIHSTTEHINAPAGISGTNTDIHSHNVIGGTTAPTGR